MFGNTREGAWGPCKQLGLLTSREVGHSRGGGKELCPQGMALHYKNYFGWIQSQGKKAASTSATDSLSRQEDPEQRQDLRMKVQALTVTMLLLVLLCSAPAPSGVLGSQAGNLERQAGTGDPGEAPWPPGDGGDKLPGQGSERSHPLARAWKVMREAHPSSRSPSKATAKALLGNGEQVPPGKPWRLAVQPSRSRIPRLSHHLKDYGKFNSDTVSTACPCSGGRGFAGGVCSPG